MMDQANSESNSAIFNEQDKQQVKGNMPLVSKNMGKQSPERELLEQIHWGDIRLQHILPPLQKGTMTLLLQQTREAASLLPRIAVSELAKGYHVHWVDGAGRVDPSRLIPHLKWQGCSPQEGLSRFLVSRAHTAHQLSAQIERLVTQGEARLVSCRVVIVDDLTAMFNDPQFSKSEGRQMLARALQNLQKLARGGVCVIISAGKAGREQIPNEQRIILKREGDLVINLQSWHGRNEKGLLVWCNQQQVRHLWRPLPQGQASLSDFKQNESNVNGSKQLLEIADSSQPKGESIAQIARKANGS